MFFKDTATTEIYKGRIVGSVRGVKRQDTAQQKHVIDLGSMMA